jgi:glycosyltransferase involved in cell wall biosynthesis
MTAPHGLRLLMSVDAVGGVWTYALDLAAGLAERGVTTVLAVLGPPPDAAQCAAAADIPGLRLMVLDQPLEWLAGSAAEIEASGIALAALAREVGADIVHLNTPAPAASVRFGVPLRIACHSCLATWWRTMQEAPMPADFGWRTELVARAYRSADLLVAPTAWFAAATRTTYDLPAAPLVVYNGRRPVLPREAAPLAPIAFTAGRLWDEGKAAQTLDSAAALLRFPLVAAGPVEGPNGARVDLHHMQPVGRLSAAAIAAILAMQPIFISAARYEPFGLAVLEAAQAGCALVLSDTLGFRELWDGVAVFVPPDDAGGFAAAITSLANDRERRAALGVAARERAYRYSLDRQVEGMLAAYEQVVGRTGRGVAA